MSYVVLARKYRPQAFDALVGQHSVSQTLGNALESDRIAHAYVFSGPRGVGKTTTARILAKCLNCEKGVTTSPCNKCPSCVAIAQGSSMQDVLEIDAASNRGIDQIRDLRENAKYAPTSSRYRIFIIDEAHQITKDAFGALLKTLEEPPSHTIFMLATTEVHKIPAPILSRCQRFSLHPIPPDLVFKHLKSICEKEKIKIEDSAMADIVRFVEGSLRDALSLLDQALVYSPDKVTSSALRELLGLLPREVVREFTRVLREGDPVAILQRTDRALQEGIDLTQLGKDLQTFYHDALLTKAGVKDPFNVEEPALLEAAKTFDFGTLERNIRLLSRALNEMRNSDTPRAVFEIYALKLGQKVLDPRLILERLEKMESGSGTLHPRVLSASPASAQSAPPSEVRKPLSNPVIPAQVAPTKISAPPAVKPVEDASSQKDSRASLNPDLVFSSWSALLHDIGKDRPALSGPLEQAQLDVVGAGIRLTFRKLLEKNLAQNSDTYLKDVFQKKWGVRPEIIFAVASPSEMPALEAVQPLPVSAPIEPVMEEEPVELEEVSPEKATAEMKALTKHFPGTIKRIKKSS